VQISKKDLKILIHYRLLEIIQEYQKAGPSYFSAATKRPAMDIDPFPEKQEDDLDYNDGGETEDTEIAEQRPDILDDHRFITLAKSQAQKEDADWRDVMLEFDDMLQEFLETGGVEDPVEFYQFLQNKLSEEDMRGKTPPPTQNTERASMNNSIASPGEMAAFNKRAMESYEPTLKTPTSAPAEPDDKLLLGDKDSSYADGFKDMVKSWYDSKDVDEDLAGDSEENPLEVTSDDFEKWGVEPTEVANMPTNVAMYYFQQKHPSADAEDYNKFLQFLSDFSQEAGVPEFDVAIGRGDIDAADAVNRQTIYQEKDDSQ